MDTPPSRPLASSENAPSKQGGGRSEAATASGGKRCPPAWRARAASSAAACIPAGPAGVRGGTDCALRRAAESRACQRPPEGPTLRGTRAEREPCFVSLGRDGFLGGVPGKPRSAWSERDPEDGGGAERKTGAPWILRGCRPPGGSQRDPRALSGPRLAPLAGLWALTSGSAGEGSRGRPAEKGWRGPSRRRSRHAGTSRHRDNGQSHLSPMRGVSTHVHRARQAREGSAQRSTLTRYDQTVVSQRRKNAEGCQGEAACHLQGPRGSVATSSPEATRPEAAGGHSSGAARQTPSKKSVSGKTILRK